MSTICTELIMLTVTLANPNSCRAQEFLVSVTARGRPMKSCLKIKAYRISGCQTPRVYLLKILTKDKFIILWKTTSKKFLRQKECRMLYLKLISKDLTLKIVTIVKKIQRLNDQFGTKCKFLINNNMRGRFKKGSNLKRFSSKQCEITSLIK